MAKWSELIGALDLQIAHPIKVETWSHRFGLLSEPDFFCRNQGKFEELHQSPQLFVEEEDKATSIISSMLGNLISGIPLSPKNEASKTTNATYPPVDILPGHLNKVIIQTGNKIDLNYSHIDNRESLSMGFEEDHLVPVNVPTWENDQDSIDYLWNDLSTDQKGIQTSIKSTTSLSSPIMTTNLNNIGTRQSQDEKGVFNYPHSTASSPVELNESNDLFSQEYLKEVLSTRPNNMLFVKEKQHPCTQILSKSNFSQLPTMGRFTSYSQNDQRYALKRLPETSLVKSPVDINKKSNEVNAALEHYENAINKMCTSSSITSACKILVHSQELGAAEKEKLNCCTQIPFKSHFSDIPSMGQVISNYQNDQQDAIQRQAETTCSRSPSNANNEEVDTAMKHENALTKMYDGYSIASIADSQSQNEKGVCNFLRSPTPSPVKLDQVISYSQQDQRDAVETFAKNPADISDINDEEIDAAMEDYENALNKMNECNSVADTCESLHRSPELEAQVVRMGSKMEIGTQTPISGGIYSSTNRCACVEKRTSMKRGLKALCLEYTFKKKTKLNLFSVPKDCPSISQLNGDFGEESFNAVGIISDADHSKLEATSEYITKTENDQPGGIYEGQEEQYKFLKEPNEEKKMEHKSLLIEKDEPHDQEVPSSTTKKPCLIGTLPIQPSANFCWQNDWQNTGQNDAGGLVDNGALAQTNLKVQCRLRLGLSKRAKPQLSLHRQQ